VAMPQTSVGFRPPAIQEALTQVRTVVLSGLA
jgi:hypothetical protein